ncbi:chromatin structure-remodeling complex subunit snf21-like [Magnolia sinica]|uniref:chromatin structure-remodeling complex subunit snf21-like n=1 Tax=Magnolia sinica TaxID=86752 RepID=UPI002658BACC|nr:chromatin structure-remodeling complex subunit snf21-like [Magnolia sinica]
MTLPSILWDGTFQDYLLVGLQLMLSLYNNKPNGILADEMSFGKIAQRRKLLLHRFQEKHAPLKFKCYYATLLLLL